MPDERAFDVDFELHAKSVGKMRCEIEVNMLAPTTETVTIITDEPPEYGGDASAPSPLATFTGALAACLMTQIRSFSRRLRIPVRGVKITGRTRWVARAQGRQPHVAEPVGFSLDVELDSDAAHGDLYHLLECAKKGCFIEQSLRPEMLTHRLRLGDEWVDA
jgi:uncharacterized OsmC-like protein